MAINFEQPEANAASPGALQAYLEAIRLTQQHGYGYGHGGGGGGPGFGGWGVQGLGGGGGHGGDGGVARDVVGEYAAMQGIDAQTRQDDINRRLQAVRNMTVGDQSPEDQARMQELQQRQQTSQNDPTGEDQPFGRPPPEFSTADKLELDRLQAGAAQVRQQLREGNIDQRTANDMLAQIQTGLSPLRTQQQQAQTQLTQQASKQAMDRDARMVSTQNMNATQYSQHVRDHTVTLEDGTRIYTSPIDGKTHVIPRDRTGPQQQAQQETQDARQVETAYRQSRTAVEREATAYERARAAHPDAPTPGWYDGPTLQGSVEREIRRRAETHLRNTQQQRGQSPQREHLDSLGATDSSGNLRSPENGPEPQPIAPDANRESLPAPQQEVLAHFDDFSRRIARVPGERQQEYRRQFHEAELLYHQYGSTAAMPADIRRRVEHIVTQLNTLPVAPRRRPVVQPAADTSMYEHGGF